MVNVVVIVVEFTTVTALWPTPPREIATVAPFVKFAPVNVTGTDVPLLPDAGLIDVSVGTRVNALNLYDFAWSHSLVMDVVWVALLAAAYFLTRRYGSGAWVLFAAVLSHWVLDWASHRPDIPLAPGFHRYYGLGLYNSPLGLLIVEGGLWVIGIVLYLRATHTRRFAGISYSHCGVHYALVSQLQRRATTKRPRSRDRRSHPLPDRVRLGILDRSFATAERDPRARITQRRESIVETGVKTQKSPAAA
jgi:membrane-bound metal-dependent hydrolase YbcI (DUF457 family)